MTDTGHHWAKKTAGVRLWVGSVVTLCCTFLLSWAGFGRAKWPCSWSRHRTSGKSLPAHTTLSFRPPQRRRGRYSDGITNKRGMSRQEKLCHFSCI